MRHYVGAISTSLFIRSFPARQSISGYYRFECSIFVIIFFRPCKYLYTLALIVYAGAHLSIEATLNRYRKRHRKRRCGTLSPLQFAFANRKRLKFVLFSYKRMTRYQL